MESETIGIYKRREGEVTIMVIDAEDDRLELDDNYVKLFEDLWVCGREISFLLRETMMLMMMMMTDDDDPSYSEFSENSTVLENAVNLAVFRISYIINWRLIHLLNWKGKFHQIRTGPVFSGSRINLSVDSCYGIFIAGLHTMEESIFFNMRASESVMDLSEWRKKWI